MTEQEKEQVITKLTSDKQMMYESNKELQAEVDYLNGLLNKVKEALELGEEVEGYEIILKLGGKLDRLAVLEKENKNLGYKTEMNDANNRHLENILKDVKDRLSYL